MLLPTIQYKDLSYRTLSYIRHIFRAKNTLGYGIHSPFLYDLVHFIIYDTNAYYCFENIEKERLRLLNNQQTVYVDDFGTKTSGNRRIDCIAKTALKPRKEAQMIFRIANALKPKCILELGTSLGITTAYLSHAAPQGKVITFEGSQAIADEAENVFTRLHLNNITQVIGNINEQLPDTLQTLNQPIDFAFIDANHQKDATLHYFDLIANHCTENSVILIDDIHASKEMAAAWKQIRHDQRVRACLDTFHTGIIFFRSQLPKRTYYIHI